MSNLRHHHSQGVRPASYRVCTVSAARRVNARAETPRPLECWRGHDDLPSFLGQSLAVSGSLVDLWQSRRSPGGPLLQLRVQVVAAAAHGGHTCRRGACRPRARLLQQPRLAGRCRGACESDTPLVTIAAPHTPPTSRCISATSRCNSAASRCISATSRAPCGSAAAVLAAACVGCGGRQSVSRSVPRSSSMERSR